MKFSSQEKRKQHRSPTWYIVTAALLVFCLMGGSLIYFIAGKAHMNQRLAEIYSWMAQEDTVFVLEAGGVSRQVVMEDREMRQVETILLMGERYKLPVTEETASVTLHIKNRNGDAALVFWAQEEDVAVRIELPGKRPFTGRCLGHQPKVAFRVLREAIVGVGK